MTTFLGSETLWLVGGRAQRWGIIRSNKSKEPLHVKILRREVIEEASKVTS